MSTKNEKMTTLNKFRTEQLLTAHREQLKELNPKHTRAIEWTKQQIAILEKELFS